MSNNRFALWLVALILVYYFGARVLDHYMPETMEEECEVYQNEKN